MAARIEALIHHLSDSLEEVEADNAALREDNERLLTAQRQILAALDEGEATERPPSPEPERAARPADLVRENARLQERLRWAEREVAGLRQLERTRAWKLVHLYWGWARRLRGGRNRPLGR
jgi:hypothetical protein